MRQNKSKHEIKMQIHVFRSGFKYIVEQIFKHSNKPLTTNCKIKLPESNHFWRIVEINNGKEETCQTYFTVPFKRHIQINVCTDIESSEAFFLMMHIISFEVNVLIYQILFYPMHNMLKQLFLQANLCFRLPKNWVVYFH